MNKTEELALAWLQKQGFTGIVYQGNRTPRFLTDQGNYEVKRAYVTKSGQFKILIYPQQKENLIKQNASVLVFSEHQETPLQTISPDELDDLGKLRAKNVILHLVQTKGERIQGIIRPDLYRWVQEKVEVGEFASESHAVERALLFLRTRMEGKVLRR